MNSLKSKISKINSFKPFDSDIKLPNTSQNTVELIETKKKNEKISWLSTYKLINFIHRIFFSYS